MSGGPHLRHPPAGTSAHSNVAGVLANVLILAANTSRLGATIHNDSRSRLFLKLGAVATITSYTVRLDPGDYYEVPFGYNGIIDGIWTSSPSGFARVVEFTQ